MGAFISKWRRKTSTVEILETLEKDINGLERSKRTNLEQQKRTVASLIIYSIVFYITAAIVFYFYFIPNLWFDRLLYCIPLLSFPVIVWLLKRFLHWFYVKRIRQNDDELERLKDRKKQILDDVMEKETYKKAKEILEKFSPPAPVQPSSTGSPKAEHQQQTTDGQQIRQRMNKLHGSPPSPMTAAGTRRPIPVTPAGGMASLPHSPQSSFSSQWQAAPGPPLARPVLPRERSTLDRLMEYLIGDGPQNRYALICSECMSHNGMALREEFEYIGFRCCYCYHVNAARKEKPRAPSLESVADTTISNRQTSSENEDVNTTVQDSAITVTKSSHVETADVTRETTGGEENANDDSTMDVDSTDHEHTSECVEDSDKKKD